MSSLLKPDSVVVARSRLSRPILRLHVPGETVPPASPARRRALVAVDTRDATRALENALLDEQLEIDWCSATDDVLARVLETSPDLICLAVECVDERLAALCRRLRNFDPGGLRAIVVVGGGELNEADAATAMEAGADDYVPGVQRGSELRARLRVQLRHLRDREVMRWARAQRRSLRDLAHQDPLTGVANRRGMERAVSEGAGASGQITVVMVDLDHFKRVNDELGHAAGDIVLCRVARALELAAGDGSVVVRWGGEEFAVVMAGPCPAPLDELGERFRLAIGNIALSDVEPTLRITGSVGVASATGACAATLSSVIEAADAALYEAKRTGRNRVMVSTLPAAG